ncbi:related to iron/ascorbate family oxidoreductases [Cephalotrichum gorgonifer]|uniref:Related to iron/ascorbate family oxidoreductases n=1 Tax=Cephalotrichum gorgonifer TaxID=2041049 RepID=A0AAE8N7K5_9PEZI|nr:related to iron/ascorbate family oxidoreductases [Cephalotrichum gorgonifer]
MAEKTKYVERDVPKISLKDFDSRIDEITSQLCSAAENVGFFGITDHGITPEEVDAIFATSESFFALPDKAKATVPWNPQNVGWEKMSQIRPSTGAADMKESYQLQFGENMNTGGGVPGKDSLWVSDEHLAGFKDKCSTFMNHMQKVSERLMLCFARGLGFPDDYFIKCHDSTRPDCQSVMRLLHYFPTPKTAISDGKTYHRAGAHADWDLLTLLFQQTGQTGLEICPGREAVTNFARGDTWSKVNFEPGVIVCNIGDLLMSWSDDRFKSTFHRVKAPCEPGDYFGESSWDRQTASTIRWSGIQQVLEEACSDTLIIMDAPYYPPPNIERKQGVLDLIAAASSEEHFRLMDRCFFTRALTEELRSKPPGPNNSSLTAAHLHAKLLSTYQKKIQDPGNEYVTGFPVPLHLQIMGNPRLPSIQLCRLHRTSLPFAADPSGPQIQISMRLKDNFFDVENWADWLRVMPDGVRDVRVEGQLPLLK